MDLQKALTTEKAAEIIGVDKRTLENWRSLGRGPAYIKISKRAIRYLYSDLIKYRDSRRVDPVNN